MQIVRTNFSFLFTFMLRDHEKVKYLYFPGVSVSPKLRCRQVTLTWLRLQRTGHQNVAEQTPQSMTNQQLNSRQSLSGSSAGWRRPSLHNLLQLQKECMNKDATYPDIPYPYFFLLLNTVNFPFDIKVIKFCRAKPRVSSGLRPHVKETWIQLG